MMNWTCWRSTAPKQEDAANKVERQVGKSAAALLLESRIGEQFDAIVTGASDKGTWARLLNIPVEGKLVQGFEGLDVGDRVRVQLMSVDVERGFIDFRESRQWVTSRSAKEMTRMKSKVGLWIDHRKAVIVTVTDEGEETKQITSDMEKHVRFSSGASEDGSAEDVRDRQFENRLNSYYDEVIACLREAETIQIFGPGEAKGELEHVLSTKDSKGASSRSKRWTR